MALVSIPQGLWYPWSPIEYASSVGALATVRTMDAAAEGVAFIGHVYINGRPAGAKTFSSSGGKIHWRSGAVTFANAGTSIDVGVQDVDTTTGQPARSDGTFDVSGTLVGGTDTIAATSLITTSMETGSKSITHGDLIAICLLMTARGWADSVVVQGVTYSAGNMWRPTISFVASGAWTELTSSQPIAVIEFDDGTLGHFFMHGQMTGMYVAATSETYADATNPDERGMLFQVPWQCKIDALAAKFSVASATTSDFTMSLYATPLGTPSALDSVAIPAESLGNTTTANPFIRGLASEIQLEANTDYMLALRATGAGNIGHNLITLADAGHRIFFPGGTTVRKGTRDGGSGAFTAESPAITLYRMGVRISAFHDSAGGGASILGGSIIK